MTQVMSMRTTKPAPSVPPPAAGGPLCRCRKLNLTSPDTSSGMSDADPPPEATRATGARIGRLTGAFHRHRNGQITIDP